MKSIVFTILFFYFSLGLYSQSSYRFVASNAVYTDLNNAKKIPFYVMDKLSGFYRLDELKGETFKWYNTLFPIDTIKTIHIQPYANLRFDNDSSLIIVDAAFTYLDSIDANSSVSYLIEGLPGDRVLKVQWKNLKIRVGAALNYINVQIWVYQKSGVMEIRYGSSSANNRSGFGPGNGPQVGIFYSLDDFTACFEKLWVNGSPTSITLDSNSNYTFKAMSGIPESGTVYQFIPRFNTLDLSQIKQSKRLHVFPNPSGSGYLNLSEAGIYKLYDMNGNLLLEQYFSETADLSKFASGVYYLSKDNHYQLIILE